MKVFPLWEVNRMRKRTKRASQANKKGRGLLTQANFLVPLATLLLKILELILRIMKVI